MSGQGFSRWTLQELIDQYEKWPNRDPENSTYDDLIIDSHEERGCSYIKIKLNKSALFKKDGN